MILSIITKYGTLRHWGCYHVSLPSCPLAHTTVLRNHLYLPVSVIGEDLITGQVQLVPLQQQLQLLIPVISVMFIGAEGC